jgi:hypothetical protein
MQKQFSIACRVVYENTIKLLIVTVLKGITPSDANAPRRSNKAGCLQDENVNV